jgi:hypothetical protein
LSQKVLTQGKDGSRGYNNHSVISDKIPHLSPHPETQKIWIKPLKTGEN